MRETKRSCKMFNLVSGRHGSRYPFMSAGSSWAINFTKSAAIDEVNHRPVCTTEMEPVPCPFASQEACADTNLGEVGIGSSASLSSLRASERFDTILCVSKTACDAAWQERIDHEHKNRTKCQATHLCWTRIVEGKCHIQLSALRFLSKHPRGSELRSASCHPCRCLNKDDTLWR